jgi:hypothetical protein
MCAFLSNRTRNSVVTVGGGLYDAGTVDEKAIAPRPIRAGAYAAGLQALQGNQ